MTLGDLAPDTLRRELRRHGTASQNRPVHRPHRFVDAGDRDAASATLYTHHEVEPGRDGAHFTLRVDPPRTLRRFVRRQVQVRFDGHEPFLPLPWQMAAPMLEAALNWCVGNFAHQFVVIHAATLAAVARALLMPAPPGSGKSTLCAA